MNYPEPSKYPIWGLDVSHHQGEIDWPTVAKTPYIKFVYIKATEGGDFKDPRFRKNWDEARKSGLAVGAYHFFTFCRPGKDQAANFLSSVPREANALPFVVDLEFGGNCKTQPSLDALLVELNAFIDEVGKIHTGKPVFYITPEFFDYYMRENKARFPNHHLWYRNIFSEPEQDQCEQWAFWQFANRGKIDGIIGPVDLNVLCPHEPDLMKLVNSIAK